MKNLKYCILTAVLAVICSCSTDELKNSNREYNKNELILFGSTEGTRKIDNEWQTGDMIGVFAWDSDKNLSQSTVKENLYNTPYVETNNGQFKVSPDREPVPYPNGGQSLDFIAYYPYSTDQLLEDFIYPINISNQTDIDKVDFLYSNNLKNLDSPTKTPRLIFKHQLSRLKLTITSPDYNLEGAKIILKNIPTKADYNLIQGSISNQNSNSDILMKSSYNNGTLEANGFVIPNDKLGYVTVNIILSNGQIFIWKTPAEWTWDSNTTYTQPLKFEKEGTKPQPKIGYFETPLLDQNNLPSNERYIVKLLSNNNPNTPGARQRNYAYLYDIDHKISYWVAYPMHPFYTRGSAGRHGSWHFDDDLESRYQVDLDEINWYRGLTPSHDRGHQVPSNDRQGSKEMNKQTFFSPNVTPQQSGLNQKIWNQLEQEINSWTTSDTIYVVTGAGFTPGKEIRKAPSKGSNPQASIPHYYYKVLAQKRNGKYRTIGFFFNHRDYTGDNDFNKYRFTVKEIEQKTGYTFFPGLPDPKVKEQDVMW